MGGGGTGIQWTDETWNPTVGCTHVSDGCGTFQDGKLVAGGCYAARQASGRLSGQPAYQGLAVAGRFTGEVRLLPERLDQPLRWRRPRRIFVDSMSDLLHPAVPVDYLAKVYAVMALAPRHTFQVLTKRPARLAVLDRPVFRDQVQQAAEVMLFEQSKPWRGFKLPAWPLRNEWRGTSVEDQAAADDRVPKLLAHPGRTPFLSMEPLLGPVDLSAHLRPWPGWCQTCGARLDPPDATYCPACRHSDYDDTAAPRRFTRPAWVIVGGESGPLARPMHPAWARSLRDQCTQAGVAFFMKQFGEWRWCYEAETWEEEQAARARGDEEYLEHPWRTLELDGTFLDGPPTDTSVVVARYGGHNGDPAGWPEDLRVREYPRQEVMADA